VPNKPKTPVRTFRLDASRWAALKAEAKRRGVSVSDLLREAVDRLLSGRP
jgi:hypothetical protein